MFLKGIALIPTDLSVNERSLRDLALQVASLKPKNLIFLVPEGHIFTDAISVDYLESVEIDGEEYSFDLGLLDEFRDILVRDTLPNVFLNPQGHEAYQIKFEFPDFAQRYLKLQKNVLPEFRMAVVSPGGLTSLDLLETGRALREAIEVSGKDSVIICFSDIYREKDPDFNNVLTDCLRMAEYEPILRLKVEPKDQSSLEALILALGATEGLKTHSARFGQTHPDGALIRFMVENLDLKETKEDFTAPSIIEAEKVFLNEQRKILKENESTVQKMVREVIKRWVEDGQASTFEDFRTIYKDKDLVKRLELQRTGVFVTIFKSGKPRGSMGSVQPLRDNIAQEIITNAIEACAYDPNYAPIGPDELDDLSFEIFVLDSLERVEPDDLDPKKYGIVVEQGFKRGVVLPDLEGIKTVEEQIRLAKARAGIIEEIDTYEPIIIDRFTVEKL